MYVFSNGIITNSSNRISTTTSPSFSGEAHQALKGVSTHHKYFHALNDTIAGHKNQLFERKSGTCQCSQHQTGVHC